MKCKHNNKSIVMLIILLWLLIIYSIYIYNSPEKFVSPDETVNHFFIDLYSKTGNLSYYDELNEISFGIIRPRGTVYFWDHVAPQKFIGFIMLVGTVETVVNGISKFISPIFAFIGLLYIYIISRELFNEKVAILTPVLLGTSIYYWYWTGLSMFENILGTSIFIIFVRYFLKIFENSDYKNYILAAIFLSLSIFIRFELFLIVPLVSVLLFLNFRKNIKLNAYRIFIFISIFFVFILPLFLLNNSLYGGYLTTGQHIKYQLEESLPIDRTFNFYNIFINLINILSLNPIFSLGIILGIFNMLSFKGNVYKNYVSLLSFGFLIFSTYILSDRVLDSNIHSSYVRYFLPFIVLLSPFLSIFVSKTRQINRYILMIFIAYFVIFGVITTTIELYSKQNTVNDYKNFNDKIVNITENNAVIFLEYWDKAIFPERKVGLVRELPQQEDKSKMLADIVIKIYETHTPTYLLMDGKFSKYIQVSEFTNELSRQGYVLVSTDISNLYKLHRKDEL